LVKPNIDFTRALESLLVRIWQEDGERLDDSHIRKTREALVDVRTIYRNKGEKLVGEKIRRYSQSIDFTQRRYRVGYIASFGERHAYLAYHHLKRIAGKTPSAIPEPQNGELTVTVIGAGAALEIFGLCYYYNEKRSRITKLKLNFVERISDWQDDRDTMMERIIKKAFRKIRTFRENININLVQDNIVLLSQQYDFIADSDIILIYNVLNEITSNPPSYQKMVWRNLEYIMKACDKRVLVLLMEPSAKYTRPRVDPIVDRLMRVSKSVIGPTEEEFTFDSMPLKIQYEDYDDGLNIKLFRNPIDGHKPTFETSLKRIHLACVRDPLSPISKFDAERQFRKITRERDARQRFKKPREQRDFFQIDSGFGTQKVTRKYLNEP
jgi:hypothetical protein